MAFDIRNYVKERLQVYNPAIDTRDGSGVNDLLVAPLSLVLDKYLEEHKYVLSRLSLSDVTNMPEAELDAIGLQYLLTRLNGTYSSGSIYVYFANPTAINIPKGTVFSTGGVDYKTTADFYLSRTALSQNQEDFYYYSAGPIPVVAYTAGDNNIIAETLFTTNIQFAITPVKIINKTAFTGGTVKETNDQFYARIINSLDGLTLASPTAIKAAIQAYDPNITMIDVVGSGSALMFRDLVTELSQIGNYVNIDYLYTLSGEHTGTYANPSIAYADIFMDIDTSDDVAFPGIASWVTEFSTDDYRNIYSKEDPLGAEASKHLLIQDFVLGSGYNPDFGIFEGSTGWNAHDSLSYDNKIFIVDEVTPTATGLRLGKTVANDAINLDVRLNYKQVTRLLADADEAIAVDHPAKKQAAYDNLMASLKEQTANSNLNNFSPVVHKQISQHQGIGIKCKMITTDNTEQGEITYITTLRNSTVFAAHDGYGLAWRKQPEFLLRMQAGTQTAADLATFRTEYSVDGTQYIGHITDHPEFWKYNVFLVDNDILQEEVWVGNEQLWDQSSGTNQFIQAAKVWIQPNIEYWFLMYIYEASGFEAWVGLDVDAFDESNRILYRGQSYPAYLPVSGSKTINAITGELELLSTRNHFGIGVGHTRNCEWLVSELTVWSIVESFPMQLFSFAIDPNDFDLAQGLNVEYYGYGYDSVLVANNAHDTLKSKVKLGVYNFTTQTWDTIGTNIYDPIENINEIYGPVPVVLDDIKISATDFGTLSNFYNAETGRIYVAATPANSGTGYTFPNSELNKDHTIKTYYVAVNNGGTTTVHRGNCTDIYCFDPANLKEGSVTTTLGVGGVITTKVLPGINSHIQEILGVREYISQIDIPGSEYVITNLDTGNTYSNDANFAITFGGSDREGALIEIYYRYWSKGTEIENAIVTSESRYPTADYKVKVSPAIVFNFKTLNYSGGPDVKQMRSVIKEYLNNLDSKSIDRSDIVNWLYQNGATYVDLNMDIELRQFDINMKKTILTWTAQTYDVSDNASYVISRFYTDDTNLAGVTKL